MPSRPIPFVIEEAGERWFCAKWKSERDRDLALTGGYLDFAPPLDGRALHQETPAAEAEADDPRGRGRPSFDDTIADAVKALGGHPTVRDIQAHIAVDENREVPNARTVQRWLRQNSRQNRRQKSTESKMPVRNRRRGC